MSAHADLTFVFPGQGSQVAGMGRDLARAFGVCRTTFDEADEALSFPLSKLCFEGPDEDLTLTANTQPAILTVSVAITRLLASCGIGPAFVAGHSLGEYSALVAAGTLSFEDAVRAVRLRGRAMQEAVPAGAGAMAAILGLAPEIVDDVCLEAADGEIVSSANYNAPEQTVIAGAASAVGRACRIASGRGAKRAIPLQVSAPFHCALMKPAEEKLAEHLDSIVFRDTAIPVVVNATAQPLSTGSDLRDALVHQVCSPVRWTESIRTLSRLGARRFIEVGPGRVLTGLLKRIDRDASGLSVEDCETLEETLTALGVHAPALESPGTRAANAASAGAPPRSQEPA